MSDVTRELSTHWLCGSETGQLNGLSNKFKRKWTAFSHSLIQSKLCFQALVTTDPSPVKPVRPSENPTASSGQAASTAQPASPTSDVSAASLTLPTLSLTQQSFPTTSTLPTVSTPIKPRKITPLSTRVENDNSSSGGQSDLLDFDNWSETESNGKVQICHAHAYTQQ